MSQANVEVVREVVSLMDFAARADDLPGRLLELTAPEVEIDMSRRVFNPYVYEGHAGLRRLVRDVQEVWEEFSITPERFVDAGERVVVIMTRHGRGKGSGVAVDQRTAGIWTVGEGKIIRMETDIDPQEALEAVGLAG
jgi:ketosteroid isomerase-like protein